MTHTIIDASQISKLYKLGRTDSTMTFQERIRSIVTSPLKTLLQRESESRSAQEFWALQRVSFKVAEGEIVGLIGRNGAGKSTLLKILSRITTPTSGRVEIRGRVGALLEVGTGFHPELTGRENIFLNGAILGMRRREIIRQFDRIVAFAEIGRFLDTPVKRYSSGMYVRLAFAVAAHLEPEVLIVDEVLAVGDAEFQRKCLGRMNELRSQDGRTIFVVSHNLEMIESLCTRGIVLNQGEIIFDGQAIEALSKYRALGGRGGEVSIVETNHIKWQRIENRGELEGVAGDGDLVFVLRFQTGSTILDGVYLDLELLDESGRKATHSRTRFVRNGFTLPANADIGIRYTVKAPMLAPGQHYLLVYIYNSSGVLAWVERIDACIISSKSYFPNAHYIDGITAATVPRFEIELI